jgi:hypothetical protein
MSTKYLDPLPGRDSVVGRRLISGTRERIGAVSRRLHYTLYPQSNTKTAAFYCLTHLPSGQSSMHCPATLLLLLLLAISVLPSASALLAAATRLRCEFLDSPISIDSAKPRFSWALPAASRRGSVQAAYRIVVSTAPATGQAAVVVWDSGVVASNRTLNIEYGGGVGQPTAVIEAATALQSDTDYSWSVSWTDEQGASSVAAVGTFSVAILGDGPASSSAGWHGAEWVSSVGNGSQSTYRTAFELSAAPVRARLYYVGLGYAKTWLNGNRTDTHELGQYVTFQVRMREKRLSFFSLFSPIFLSISNIDNTHPGPPYFFYQNTEQNGR